jgi:hypothetical protein
MSLLAKLLGRPTTEAVAWLETDELSALLTGPSPPLVIDVRGPAEFSGPLGHIDEAKNIPLDQIPRTPLICWANSGRWFWFVIQTDAPRQRRTICGGRADPKSPFYAVTWWRGGLLRRVDAGEFIIRCGLVGG